MNPLVSPAPCMPSLSDYVSLSSPFSFLGLHENPNSEGLLLRVWQPSALTVEVIEHSSGNSLGEMSELSPGMFELSLPQYHKKFTYRLNIFRVDGLSDSLYDPYQFDESVFAQNDIEALALYRHVGALPHRHATGNRGYVNGVMFKVYAPNASSISVLGDFNQWDGELHPMSKANDGYWRLFIPGVKEGELYKYEIHDANGKELPLKSDPFARSNEQWPGLASIVCSPMQYQWQDTEWKPAKKTPYESPISIYEVHTGSWKRKLNGAFLNYRELADELVPYVASTGFTHIQLMPVSEYPDYESWGYQPVCLFAPSSRFGTPDMLKYLIDKSHQAGLGVILDWVPAQFPADNHGLARFDGSPLFEYDDDRKGWHPQWQTHIYDFGNLWVQNFLISNALYWLDEFHIDGLRIDAVSSMLYLNEGRNSGQWLTNEQGGHEHLEAIRFLQRLNDAIQLHFPETTGRKLHTYGYTKIAV